MDGFSRNTGSEVTAVVVRQFAPSRVERQLLAQVFELVCGERGTLEESPSGEQNAAHTPRAGNGAMAIETHVRRRRAA